MVGKQNGTNPDPGNLCHRGLQAVQADARVVEG